MRAAGAAGPAPLRRGVGAAICENAEDICAIADELGDDDWS
ncbi:MAG: hypothetical protein R3B06_13045 [Kofleriaceae bacterium]